jgi:hypothetical protein
MTDWKTKLAGKRLIFTVTSGRSGTHFLTRLFHYLPGMDVFHEEMTHSYHTALRATQLDPSAGRRFLEDQKLPFIAAQHKPIFVETSHLICKGFLEHFLDLGLVPDLVLLSRARRKIAVSLYRLGTIPARNEKALQFYLTPDDPHVVTAPDWQQWSDYQLCYWYVMEIERRQRIYGERILSLGGRVHACSLENLATRSGYCDMIRSLGLRGPSLLNWLKFYRSRNRKAGDFSAMKNQRVLPDDIENEERSIESLFVGTSH